MLLIIRYQIIVLLNIKLYFIINRIQSTYFLYLGKSRLLLFELQILIAIMSIVIFFGDFISFQPHYSLCGNFPIRFAAK